MSTTTSADGTRISFTAVGDGRTVVIVNGALSTGADAAPLAEALADAGFRAVTWDRRARAGSGDRAGSTPDDEVADLAAVIEGVGGADAVLGHSSGAILALYAASQGVSTGALFLSEPPIQFADAVPTPSPASADASPGSSGRVDPFGDELAARLQQLVDDGHPDEAVAVFQLEAVGLPVEMVEAGRTNGMLATLAPLGQSVVYDTRLTLRMKQPGSDVLTVSAPVTVLRGEQTFPFLIGSSDRLAGAVPGAELVVVPESVMHRADPVATARVIAERL